MTKKGFCDIDLDEMNEGQVLYRGSEIKEIAGGEYCPVICAANTDYHMQDLYEGEVSIFYVCDEQGEWVEVEFEDVTILISDGDWTAV